MKRHIALILPLLLAAYPAGASDTGTGPDAGYPPDIGPDVLVLEAAAIDRTVLQAESVILIVPQAAATSAETFTVFVETPWSDPALPALLSEKEVFRSCGITYDPNASDYRLNRTTETPYLDNRRGRESGFTRYPEDIKTSRYRRC